MALATPVRYRFASFELQVDERRLLRDGQPVQLGARAFDLLVALVENSDRLMTKDMLLARVWGQVVVEENALQAHISALRKGLGPQAIETVSGQGYRFKLDVEPVRQPPQTQSPPGHNLPQQLTTFIGRERELSELRRWLASARLLTLTGAGGCGKTRLALQVAGVSLDGYSDGVYLVELAPLGDPTLIAQSVAKALAIPAKPGQETVLTVLEWLAVRRLLLVLDNAEHLLEACAHLADRLLRHCAHLGILVTSRERLGIAGELNYRVPSLSLPEGTNIEVVLSSEAARLFIDRVRLHQPDFQVTGEDAQALASICRRLDGIALAIELAAPRVRVMSLGALSARLDDRFRLLTGGSRSALPRHRTLRSLIDWSHELLTEPEKAVLRRASVFAGGWTLEAAGQICSGERVERSDMLDLLSALADKNLVVTQMHDEGTRFGMLETVRHYAQEKLRESGEDETVHDRHVEYLMDMARGLDSTRDDAAIQQTLLRLDAEHDNLRSALAWCESVSTRSLDGLRLAGLLNWFWQVRGHYGEGRAWLARLLAVVPANEHGEIHARALHASGALAMFDGHIAAAVAPHRKAIALWRQLGNRRQLARSLGSLGDVEMDLCNLSAARGLFEEALTIAREIGDRRSVSLALSQLAEACRRSSDYAAAQVLLEECLTISGAVGPWMVAHALFGLGSVRHACGDLEGAHEALSEALRQIRGFGDIGQIAATLRVLAEVAQDLRDLPAARALIRESLHTFPAIDDQRLRWLESFAGLSLEWSGPICAARLWGCVQRLREETGHASWNPSRHLRQVAAARGVLNDDQIFDRAWSDGRSWSLDEAMRYARTLL